MVFGEAAGDTINAPNAQVSMPQNLTEPAQDEGITVKGTPTHQHFRNGYIGELEPNAQVIIIRLKGTSKIAGAEIIAPVEVKTKTKCPTCGTMIKSGNKYCSDCGTCVIDM
jgi:hypothetical protein